MRLILTTTVLLWLLQHLLNNIDPAEFKVYAVVQSLLLFVPLLMIIMGSGLGRFVIERLAKGDERGVTQVISTATPLCAGTGLLLLLLGGLFIWNMDVLSIAPEFLLDAQLMFLVLVGTAAVNLFTMPFTVGFDARQKHAWRDVIFLAGEVLYCGALLGLMFGEGTRALWAVVAGIPRTLFTMAVTLWFSWRLLPSARFRIGEFRRDLVRPILSFGGWTVVARLAAAMREACGPLLLNEFPATRATELRDAAVTNYRAGGIVESRVYPTALTPLGTTLPALTAMYATGQEERLRSAFFRLARYVVWSYLFFSIPLSLYHAEFWTLYSDDAPLAGIVMVLLLGKAIIVFPQPVMAQIVAARAMTRPMAIRVVGVEGSNLIAMLAAILFFDAGAVGIAATSLVTTFIVYPPLIWTFALSLTSSTLGEMIRHMLLPGLAPAVLSAPIWVGCRLLFSPTTWAELVLAGTIVSVAYLGTMVAFCLSASEREDLKHVLLRLRRLIPGR